MIVASVGTWERPCVCFVDSGLEVLGYQDEVYLVVNLPIRGIPDNLHGWRVLARVSQWLLGALRVSILCRLSLQCQIFLLSLPSVGKR